ncbi:hypothetical protein D3C74_07460 [compost metagenome]
MTEQSKATVISATMRKEEDGSFLGQAVFKMEGQKSAFEISFFSKKGKEWDYSLHYAEGERIEEELLAIDELLAEDDDLFDMLLDAARDTMESK